MNVVAASVALSSLVLFVSVGCKPSTNTTSAYERESHEGRTFYLFVCKLVKDRLKSPATAKFADIYDSSVSYEGRSDDTWVVSGYVDAQNSFSAMIRTQFRAVARRTPDGGAEALCLVFGDEIIGDITAFDTPERKATIAKEHADNVAHAAKIYADRDARDKQIGIERLETQRAEREKAAAEERRREAESKQKLREEWTAAAERVLREEQAAAWVFPRSVTTTSPVQVAGKFGTLTIPVGTNVKAVEARQGMVRIEHAGSTALVPPATVRLPPQP